MKFIDEITLTVKAGDGGNGCVSFRHEKRNPRGGPDGGNGGNGGNIYFQGDEQLNSFFSFSGKKHWTAENGQNGQSSLKIGKSGQDLYIKVPLGTIIKKEKDDTIPEQIQEIILGEITLSQQVFLIAKGGKGGLGNNALTSSVNRAPRYAQKGTVGKYLKLNLELRILADIGLLGLPSAGKTTLINALGGTCLKVGAYSFTTLQPQLVVLKKNEQKLTIADLPGIIEGAAQNKGLGLRFLRHISRCPILVYVLDTSQVNPENDFYVLQKELEQSKINVQEKQKIIIWNKIDLLNFQQQKNLQKVEKKLGEYIFINLSALQKINLEELVDKMFAVLAEAKNNFIEQKLPLHQVYDFTSDVNYEVIALKTNYWKLAGSAIENLYQKHYRVNDKEKVNKLLKDLRLLSLEEKFRLAGVKNNDTVVIGKEEFFWHYD